MIWALAREQVRAQRRYIAWAAVVVALAVGSAVYGTLIGITLSQASEATRSALVYDVPLATSGMASEASVAGVPTASAEEIANAVADAQAQGNRVGGLARFWELGIEQESLDSYVPWAVAGTGDIGWDAIIVEGHEPGPGEVALSEAYAQRLGVTIGDTVPFFSDDPDDGALGLSATVSGLARSPFDSAGLALNDLPDLWIAWSDLSAYSSALTQPDDSSIIGAAPDVQVYWDGESRELTALFGPDAVWENSQATTSENSATPWIALGTIVFVIGAVAMAFAFGRAQAQSRTQWVATARALGASRRHVVMATMGEAGLLAGLGLVGGVVLGWIGATAHLTLVHHDVPGASIASTPSGTLLVVLGALVLSVVLALVVAGVPAFWATRVSPTAALKPENDITNAEVGRRVRFWPVALVWVFAGLVAVASVASRDDAGAPLWGMLALSLFVILTLIVANETLRWLMPVIGRWLSRRQEKTAIVAGDTIIARPRQFTVPALLVTLGVGSLLTVAANSILTMAAQWEDSFELMGQDELAGYLRESWVGPAAVIVLGAVTVLATVITAATSAVTARERATREALGVSARQTRAGAGVAQAVTVLTGVALGTIFAAIMTVELAAFGRLTGLHEPLMASEVFSALTIVAVAVIGVGVGCALLSALVIAGLSRTPSVPGLPTAQLRTAGDRSTRSP